MKRRPLFVLMAAAFLLVLGTNLPAEEEPRTATVVYLKNGKVIVCDRGTVEKDCVVCEKHGGTISIPLNSVDLGKTFSASADERESEIEKEIETERKRTREKDKKIGRTPPKRDVSGIHSASATWKACSIHISDFDVRMMTTKGPYWQVSFVITNSSPKRMLAQITLSGIDSEGHIVDSHSVEERLIQRETKYHQSRLYYEKTGVHHNIVKWEPTEVRTQLPGATGIYCEGELR